MIRHAAMLGTGSNVPTCVASGLGTMHLHDSTRRDCLTSTPFKKTTRNEDAVDQRAAPHQKNENGWLNAPPDRVGSKRAAFMRVDRQLLRDAFGEPLTRMLLTVPSGATVTEILTWMSLKPVPQATMLERTASTPRRIIERSSFSERPLAGFFATG